MPDPDASVQIGRLARRADFLRAARGKRWHSGSLTVQASQADPARGEARIGFTLTRKVGCAVVRNRARRRLKEAVRLSSDLPVEPGRDYVIIGRLDALRVPFERLKHELAQAIRGATGRGVTRGGARDGRRSAEGVAGKSSGAAGKSSGAAGKSSGAAGGSREIRPERTRPDQ